MRNQIKLANLCVCQAIALYYLAWSTLEDCSLMYVSSLSAEALEVSTQLKNDDEQTGQTSPHNKPQVCIQYTVHLYCIMTLTF